MRIVLTQASPLLLTLRRCETVRLHKSRSFGGSGETTTRTTTGAVCCLLLNLLNEADVWSLLAPREAGGSCFCATWREAQSTQARKDGDTAICADVRRPGPTS